MIITPLAAESLGVRSMATYVECGATRVLIDPGAVLAPNRFGLPPAEEEWEALRRANDRISAYAARASMVFVSHYHEDHFRHDPELYAGRRLWAKDPKRHVEGRQAQRAATFWRALAGRCEPDAAEDRRLETAEAVLQASPPLSHGPDGTALGYVVALTIEDRREGTRFVHASDVQGPLSPVAAAYLARQRPTVLYLAGPPAYLESQLGAELIERGIEHLLRIIDQTGCHVILDHYALRDAAYPERFRRLWETGRVATAAGYLGLADAPLEARRAERWPGRRKPPAPVRPSRARGAAEGLRRAREG
ncbi:MAG: MBL fold metallo-hydrolase [Candidatus Rokuibacteriota bacterium]